MRALSCRPGTVFVIGVRWAALGAITPRSKVGVKAPGGTLGSELSAGVVSGLLVVRSVLTKQLTSARRLPRALRTSSQVTPARAEKGRRSTSKTKERIVRNIVSSFVRAARPGRSWYQT